MAGVLIVRLRWHRKLRYQEINAWMSNPKGSFILQ